MWAEVLDFLHTTPNIFGAFAYDVKGKVFARYRRDSKALGAGSVKKSSPREFTLSKGLAHQFQGKFLYVQIPIELDGKRIGTVELQTDLKHLETELLVNIGIVLLVLSVCLGLALTLANHLQKSISGPIQKLSSAIDRVGQDKKFTLTVDRESEDEIGDMIEGFNTMLRELHLRDTELTRYRDQLEERVAERTADLNESYQNLTLTIEDLKAAQSAAEAANHAKSMFLSSMSHELRTPLNAILGFSQMLDINPKEPLSATQQKCVDHVLGSGSHLLALIDSILDLAKIEAGQIDCTIQTVDPGPCITEAMNMMQGLADKRDINLTAPALAARSLPSIKADPQRLNQILLNLISNAVKYNRDGGTVTVDGAVSGGENPVLRISVTDTGIGIPADRKNEIFSPFNRLGRESSDVEGSGVGLALSKQLTEIMGGEIGFETQAELGSTFWIDLKITDEIVKLKEATAPGEDAVLAATPSPSGKLLYIEDNPANLELMAMIIDNVSALEMISADNAETGIELAIQQQLDLVFMDVNLPGMSGIEAVRELKKNKATKFIPVVGVSASAYQDDIDDGIKAGFESYLTKPVQVKDVLVTIDKILMKADV
jgi:signal transduction histidine kinase/CheY-like chemotaxis protein